MTTSGIPYFLLKCVVSPAAPATFVDASPTIESPVVSSKFPTQICASSSFVSPATKLSMLILLLVTSFQEYFPVFGYSTASSEYFTSIGEDFFTFHSILSATAF